MRPITQLYDLYECSWCSTWTAYKWLATPRADEHKPMCWRCIEKHFLPVATAEPASSQG